MDTEKYLGMREGDLEGKPYAKYWNPDMAPMQEQVRQAVAHGVEAPALGFTISEVDQLLQAGYLALENGFTRLDNGQVFVSVLTRMPGVSGKMIDWWMGWHPVESQRYKLWHPRAHVANRAEKMIGDDPAISDRDKYLHNSNYVTEYVGADLLEIEIRFSEPSDFFDTRGFQEANVGTAICGVVGFRKLPVSFGLLIHLIRETDDGCEMRSRFWLGNIAFRGLPGKEILNRITATRFLRRHAVPLSMGRDLLVHCGMEMNHLASFLPDLYTDYHNTRTGVI